MTMTTVRRGVAGVLLLTQAACAAQGAGRPATATVPPVTHADRERCEFLAADEETRDNAARSADGGLGGLIFIGLMAGPAAVLFLAPFVIVMANKDRWKAQARGREQGMSDCLAPLRLAQEHGPQHPAVASALVVLAWRYVRVRQFEEAEKLYARATAIAEQAGEPAVLADVLEHHGWALQVMNRNTEGIALEDQARTLRPRPSAPAIDDEPGDATPAGD